ncbi:MAG: hypothetical protein ABIH64_07025, partial [Nanoarchaeota archaeon]
CTESWSCTDWTPETCPSSQRQTRTCIDNNDCGTTEDKPKSYRTCTYHPIEQPTEEPPSQQEQESTFSFKVEPIQEELPSPISSGKPYLLFIIGAIIIASALLTTILINKKRNKSKLDILYTLLKSSWVHYKKGHFREADTEYLKARATYLTLNKKGKHIAYNDTMRLYYTLNSRRLYLMRGYREQ